MTVRTDVRCKTKLQKSLCICLELLRYKVVVSLKRYGLVPCFAAHRAVVAGSAEPNLRQRPPDWHVTEPLLAAAVDMQPAVA